MTDECEFDPAIAEELAGRWAVLERLAATYGGDTRPLLLAVRDARATELRLLQSARPLEETTVALAGHLERAQQAAATAGLVDEAKVIEVLQVGAARTQKRLAEATVPPKSHGNPPGAPGKDGRAYTEAEKVEAVKLYATVGRNETVRRTGISKATITRWAQERPDLVRETKFDAEMAERETVESAEDDGTKEAPVGLDDTNLADWEPETEARQRRHDAIRARSVEGAFTDGEL